MFMINSFFSDRLRCMLVHSFTGANVKEMCCPGQNAIRYWHSLQASCCLCVCVCVCVRAHAHMHERFHVLMGVCAYMRVFCVCVHGLLFCSFFFYLLVFVLDRVGLTEHHAKH